MSQADDWPELFPPGSVITASPCCNLAGLFGSGITATRCVKIVPNQTFSMLPFCEQKTFSVLQQCQSNPLHINIFLGRGWHTISHKSITFLKMTSWTSMEWREASSWEQWALGTLARKATAVGGVGHLVELHLLEPGQTLGSYWYLPGPAGTRSSTWWRSCWTRPRTLMTARGTRLSRSPSVSLRGTCARYLFIYFV
eukprot:TRINITY_DN12251_c0_g1_i1.p1 TRINITY_DN12251_c0_g1~~TRINITY_DN12251_c0_g1_i1.p1  ORF type:complete len:197 (-),score=24.60 TRINITY_DN12251_c0_g1_i1:51-641(-)